MTNRLSEVMESNAVERLATGFVFTEGPLWHPDGYFFDVWNDADFEIEFRYQKLPKRAHFGSILTPK